MGSAPQRTKPLVPLTPDDVRRTTFSQSQLAWRGYSEDEVDAFKARVANAMVAAEKERAGLRAEIERLRNFYREHGDDVDVVRGSSRGRGHREFNSQDLVGRISEYAEVQIAQAREYADLVDRHAGEQADEVLHHARVRSALSVEEWLRTLHEAGHAVGMGELKRALTWLRDFAYALQAELKVVDGVLLREGQRQDSAGGIAPPQG